jgi:hypothetical protein
MNACSLLCIEFLPAHRYKPPDAKTEERKKGMKKVRYR